MILTIFKNLFQYNSTLINLDIGNTNITQGVFDAFIDILKMPSCALKVFRITCISRYCIDFYLTSYTTDDVHFNYDKLIDAIKNNDNPAIKEVVTAVGGPNSAGYKKLRANSDAIDKLLRGQ